MIYKNTSYPKAGCVFLCFVLQWLMIKFYSIQIYSDWHRNIAK